MKNSRIFQLPVKQLLGILFITCGLHIASANYTLNVYTSMPAGLETTFINDSGDVAGWKFYYDSATGVTTSLGNFDSPLIRDMNENGTALAMESWIESGASRYRSYLFDGVTKTQLTSTNGEDPLGHQLDEQGNVFGGTYRRVGNQTLSRPTIFNSNGSVEYLPFLYNGSHSEGGTYLRNSSGNVLGWSTVNSDFVSKVVAWSNGGASVVESILGSQATVGFIQALSDGRAILGHATGNTYQAYTIWDNGVQSVLDTGGLSVATYELDGTVIGQFRDSNNVLQNAFYHPSTGVTKFADIMALHEPMNWHYQFHDRNADGVFVGYARSQNTATRVATLTPEAVPEPAILGVAVVAAIGMLRKRVR